jgi:hypothetical protein
MECSYLFKIEIDLSGKDDPPIISTEWFPKTPDNGIKDFVLK